MKTLKSQIALLALGISLFAALTTAFMPHYVYDARDTLFMLSLSGADQDALSELIKTHGQCSPLVEKFQFDRGYGAWDINFTAVKFMIAGVATLLCTWLATRYAGRITRPIQQLSNAANAIRQGSNNIAFPDTKSVSEIADLGSNFSRMHDWLKASDEDLKLRSSGIAHEIRTPLAVMRARLIGVQENIYQPDAALVSGLLRQIELIDQMTTDISLLYDTSGSSQALQKSQADVRLICDAVVYSLAPLAQESGVVINVIGQAAPVDVDAAKLERAIANLVRNAIQHGKCKNIDVAVSVQNDQLVIDCDDDGVGWPLEKPETLLKAFVTGDEKAEQAAGRTGLGLALVDAIAKAHDGKLVLGRSKREGARASIIIPAL
jgi:signal transduction histidine kinase